MFVLWRLLLFLPLILTHNTIPFHKGYEYTLTTYFTKSTNPINHYLLSPWANFDGLYYLLIAGKGYTENGGFFPLFPLIINLLTRPFELVLPFDPVQYLIANILVNLFFLGALIALALLFRQDYDEKISFFSIILLLFFPLSFYFASIYTEGLFLLLSVMALYFARKKKWLAAGISGMFLSATRIVGIMIFPALICEYYITEIKGKKKSWGNASSLLLVPMGLVSYMIYSNIKWHNPLYFVKAQGNFGNNRSVTSIVLFPQTVYRYFKIFITVSPSTHEWQIALLELSSFLFAGILLYVAWKKRVRLSYIVFSLLSLLVPASTGTFSGLPRYVAVVFPIFLALALTKNKPLLFVYILIGGFLSFFLFSLFANGYYVS